MEKLIKNLKKRAKKDPRRIIFPESTEPRILKAVQIIQKEGIAKVILLGNQKEIEKTAKSIKVNLKGITIIDPINSDRLTVYADQLYKLRKEKGMTLEEACKLMKENSRYFGTMMIKMCDADGLISGSIHPTSDTVRPALQIIKTKEEGGLVSSFFLMKHRDEFYIFSDCSVNILPDEKQLAQIAISSADSAKELFGIKPRVALLSFSTHGSGVHPLVDKVRNASQIAQKLRPDLTIDGELQVDAALIPWVCKVKCKTNHLKGKANVLIFPDLQAGNIAYKLVEWLGHYEAIGPILQGLAKPVTDLSRGCVVKDIVDICTLTVIQAQIAEKK
jgi:phosphate acetyltransferase